METPRWAPDQRAPPEPGSRPALAAVARGNGAESRRL